jgi:hypothetical protein
MSDGQLIASVPKNIRERIEIRLRQFEGHDFVDLRVHYEDGNEYKPTRRGIGIRPSLIRAVIEGLELAEVEAKAAGLIKGADHG